MILIPDDSEVSLLDLVFGLQRPESAVVKDGHEEALRKVVEMLSERRNFELSQSGSAKFNPGTCLFLVPDRVNLIDFPVYIVIF